MPDNRMALWEMAEEAGETNFLRDLVRQVVQKLMEAAIDADCAAERSAARADQHIGYRSRLSVPLDSSHR